MAYRRSTALVTAVLVGVVTLAFALPPAGAQGCPTISVSPPSGTPLPTGTVGEPYEAQITASGASDPYFWQLTGGALPPGLDWNPKGSGPNILTISGTPTSHGFYNPTWQVYDDGGGQCLGSPAGYTITIEPVDADVFVQKNATPNPVTVGQALTYTMTVGNGGPATAKSVTLSDPLAANVTIQSITTSRGSCNSGDLVFCNLGDIPMNEGAEVTVVTSVSEPGTITNTATVSSSSNDPFPGNNSATRQVEVVESTENADLSVVKRGPDDSRLNRIVTYNVTVRNDGDDPAADVVVTDTWDSALADFDNASSGCTAGAVVTCQLGTIPVGGTREISIDLLTKAPGKLVNTASVSSSANDPNPANNTDKKTTIVKGLELIGLEITQAVQNWKQSVPLIANRETYVRAHVRAVGGAVKDVRAQIKGSLIDSTETLSRTEATPIYPRSGALDIVTKPNRAKLDETYLFQVPFRWTDPGNKVDITFEGIDGARFACRDVGEDCGAIGVFTKYPIPKFRFFGIRYYFGGKQIVPDQRLFAAAQAQLEGALPFGEYRSADGGDAIDLLQLLGLDEGAPISPLDYKLILKRLQVLRAWNACFAATGCTEYYVGLIPMSAGTGPPTTEGAGAAGVAFAYVSSKQDDTTLAHEIAHAAGRGHTLCPGMSSDVGAIDQSYPYAQGRLSTVFEGEDAFWGLNTNLFNAALPKVLSPATTYDLMSYCSPAWPSDYTWNAVTIAFAARFGGFPALQMSHADVQTTFLVSGETRPDGTGSLSPIYQIEAPPSEPSGGEYAIELGASDGTTLATYPFDPDTNHGEGFFVMQVPFDAAATRIALVHGNTELDSWSASGAAPNVQVVEPTIGDDGTVDLEWDVVDDGGDDAFSTVQYSPDGGITWQTLAVDVPGNQLQVALSQLAGSAVGMFQVVTTDGFSSGSDETDVALVIPHHSPELSIIAPLDGAVVTTGSTTILSAVGSDLEDGFFDPASITWESSLDGPLGSGDALEAEDLRVGEHVITATATDTSGRASTDSIRVSVFDEVPTDIYCDGVAPTMLGSSDGERLFGSDGLDIIFAAAGNDSVRGSGGADRLCGSGGKDTILGQAGPDVLFGAAGRDVIDGGSGRDVCYGGPGRDRFKNCEVKKP